MQKTLGIYFTHSHCHSVITQITQNQALITNALRIPLTEQSNTAKIAALNSMKSALKLPKKIILGISYQYVTIKTISVDNQLNDNEIFQFLQAHIKEKYLDYEYLHTQDSSKRIRTISADEIYITEQTQLFKRAKIPLHVIDVDSSALERLSLFTKTLLPSPNNQNAIGNFPEKNNHIPFLVALGLSLWGFEK